MTKISEKKTKTKTRGSLLVGIFFFLIDVHSSLKYTFYADNLIVTSECTYT